MKKITFFLLLCIVQGEVFSQCDAPVDSGPISRGVLARLIFEVLYQDNTDVYSYEASNFPNPFIDLQESTELVTKIRYCHTYNMTMALYFTITQMVCRFASNPTPSSQ